MKYYIYIFTLFLLSLSVFATDHFIATNNDQSIQIQAECVDLEGLMIAQSFIINGSLPFTIDAVITTAQKIGSPTDNVTIIISEHNTSSDTPTIISVDEFQNNKSAIANKRINDYISVLGSGEFSSGSLSNVTFNFSSATLLEPNTPYDIIIYRDGSGNDNYAFYYDNTSSNDQDIFYEMKSTFGGGACSSVFWERSNTSDFSMTVQYTEINDTTAPNITIHNPESITYNTTEIVINATVTDNFDVDTVIFYNGTINQTYTVPFTATFVEGNHTIIFYANDTSGNVNQTEVSFFVDTTAPTISFVSPTTGTSNDSNVTINISTTGDDIDTVTLFNGTDNQTYTNEFSALFVDGEHTFIAYVNDTAGNNAQTSVTFTVDTTPAQVPLGVLVSILSIGLVIALLASLIGLKEVDNPVLKYSALVISTSIILVILFYGLNFF